MASTGHKIQHCSTNATKFMFGQYKYEVGIEPKYFQNNYRSYIITMTTQVNVYENNVVFSFLCALTESYSFTYSVN